METIALWSLALCGSQPESCAEALSPGGGQHESHQKAELSVLPLWRRGGACPSEAAVCAWPVTS